VRYRMRKLITVHLKAVLIHLLIQIINGVHLRMIVKFAVYDGMQT
jgi:hypothetical protein